LKYRDESRIPATDPEVYQYSIDHLGGRFVSHCSGDYNPTKWAEIKDSALA
jgi:hypothetical protein